MAYEYERELMDYLNQIKASLLARPLLLGGIAASGGGVGGPPGGFLGQLPQTRVTFDITEAEEWPYAVNASGYPSGTSLVTNLNRIRYRLANLEAGGGGVGNLIVREDGILVASGVTVIDFVGANIVSVNPIVGGVTVAIHDPVTVTDSSTINFTLTDQNITGDVIPSGIKLDDLGTPDDNTDLNVSTTRHGLTPKLSGNANEYFNGIGGWTTPSGVASSGGGSITVRELDTTPTVTDVTVITFEGAVVADQGSGEVRVTVSGGVATADSSMWTSNAEPDSPHAMDDEFDDGTVTGWTEFDIAGTIQTYSEQEYGLRLIQAEHTGLRVTGVYKSVSEMDFSIVTHVSLTKVGNVLVQGGIAIFDNAAGDNAILTHVLGIDNTDDSVRVAGHNWTEDQGIGTAWFDINFGQLPTSLYLRADCVDDGGSAVIVDCYFSTDGVGWKYAGSIDAAFVPSHVGLIYWGTPGTGSVSAATFSFFRYTSGAVAAYVPTSGNRIKVFNK